MFELFILNNRLNIPLSPHANPLILTVVRQINLIKTNLVVGGLTPLSDIDLFKLRSISYIFNDNNEKVER